MKFFYIIFLFLVTCVSAENKSKVNVSAKSYLVIQMNNQKVLFRKEEATVYPVASITKLITAIISKDHFAQTELVQVPNSAVVKNNYESKAGLKNNQKYKFEDLLIGLLVPSGNDVARTIESAMNKKGFNFEKVSTDYLNKNKLNSSHFAESVGISSRSVSTALDLSNILKIVKSNHSDLIKILKLTEASIVSFDDDRIHFVSRNRVHSYKNFSVYGKTGTTKKAGQCFAGFFENDNKIYSVVIIGSDDYEIDLKKIIDTLE